MTYPEATRYLNSLVNYEQKTDFPYKSSFKLERIERFLAILGNPQEGLNIMHIAGSKGKGSTAIFCAYILREAGYKVGVYTSPHLDTFRERIRILQQRTENRKQETEEDFEGMVEEDDVSKLVERLKPYIEDFNSKLEFGRLSFFEVYTALALLYFKEEKTDFVILETGLGGRLDATNVAKPLICAITPISYEHTHILGRSLKQIASEKAGIIKTNRKNGTKSIVITAVQEGEVMQIIRDRCKECNVKLYELNKDIFFEEVSYNPNYQIFNMRGIFQEYPHLKINILGRHQIQNATLSMGIIEALRFWNVCIDSSFIRKGLNSVRWPGRFELVSKNPPIVLDGAQNVASALALEDTLKQFFPLKNVIAILGISKDKDIKGISRVLSQISNRIILTQANNPRASEPNVLKKFFKKDKIIKVTASIEEALIVAKTHLGKDDLILVTGSLFVVGEARKICLN